MCKTVPRLVQPSGPKWQYPALHSNYALLGGATVVNSTSPPPGPSVGQANPPNRTREQGTSADMAPSQYRFVARKWTSNGPTAASPASLFWVHAVKRGNLMRTGPTCFKPYRGDDLRRPLDCEVRRCHEARVSGCRGSSGPEYTRVQTQPVSIPLNGAGERRLQLAQPPVFP